MAQSEIYTTEGDQPALRRLLLEGLAPMLYPPGPTSSPRWICVVVGPCDRPLGGLIGLTTGAWLSIDLLWLPESERRKGLGSAVLHAAERQAVAGGCIGAHVATTSEAAGRFYERNGYVARMRPADLRPGLTQITLQKSFK